MFDRSYFQKEYMRTTHLFGEKTSWETAKKAEMFLLSLGFKDSDSSKLFELWITAGNKRPPTIHELICITKDNKLISPPPQKEIYHCVFCNDTGTIWRFNLITRYDSEFRCNCSNADKYPKEVMLLNMNNKNNFIWFMINHDEWLMKESEQPESLKERIREAKNYTFVFDKNEKGSMIPFYFHKFDKSKNEKMYNNNDKYLFIKKNYPKYF